jgi:hydroxymethylpyrimidine pyrophosphatase-like HAD family hydrolase
MTISYNLSPSAATVQGPQPAGWEKLEDVLRTVRASELLVISDMTGTLITQGQDGMTPHVRDSIRSIITRGASFVLATADSGHSVESFFLRPLQAQDLSNLYVVHSVGAWRGEVVQGELRALSHGDEISVEDRAELLSAMDRAVQTALGLSGSIFSELQHDPARLIETGARMSLQRLSSHFGPQSFIEVIPSKAAIFFLDSKIAGPLEQEVFNAYVMDPSVQGIVRGKGCQLLQGGNYVDIFTCTKEVGVRDLLSKTSIPNRRSLIVLGDSENDSGLLREPYQGFETILRVFVGESHSVVGEMMTSSLRHEFYHLPAHYCEGSARVLGAIPS